MDSRSPRPAVGAVYDRAYFVDSRKARGHRPRIQTDCGGDADSTHPAGLLKNCNPPFEGLDGIEVI
jgi:hypothetical protein